ncbi:hypothetical protein [Legionella taurinensis]|uniref:Uncharacterized protein n=1 Tax=Legionella taurinensis TaxID=70611 RepID=A0A3A5LJX7_9GAMM|nr:hypothetical protein [Legionella taurinensis]RJT48372.1 hypothetical protein D6J04_04540 [Legionella taurinensis]RJT68964.1 hypothetical protein D6J03_02675 [Legionella taurinensis]STY26122.1 Uncharacterised protein [Legionella taurinensis]
MTFHKKEVPPYQQKMNEYLARVADFIDNVYGAMADQTVDEKERQHRLDAFTLLLLKATHAEPAQFKKEFSSHFPLMENDTTIQYIHNYLCEINGFCTKTLSDEYENYKPLFDSITFLLPETRQLIREQLSKQLSDLILKKTNTPISSEPLAKKPGSP